MSTWALIIMVVIYSNENGQNHSDVDLNSLTGFKSLAACKDAEAEVLGGLIYEAVPVTMKTLCVEIK